MQPTAETLIVVAIVGAALAFLGRRMWRALRATRAKGGAGCESGCGCEPGGHTKPRDWAET